MTGRPGLWSRLAAAERGAGARVGDVPTSAEIGAVVARIAARVRRRIAARLAGVEPPHERPSAVHADRSAFDRYLAAHGLAVDPAATRAEITRRLDALAAVEHR